jgi:Domain of unknown function (DUF4214)
MRSFIIVAMLIGLTPAAAQAQVYGDSNSLVDYWYRTYLGRAPDPQGLATWANQLNQGVPVNQVLATILASDEYYQRAGGTPQGFIARLYNDFLNRAPAGADLDFWVRQMYTEDRSVLVLQLLEQNPGVWVEPSPAVSTAVPVAPTVVVPGIAGRAGWYRDLHRDWDHRHNVYDYRRPDIHHGNEHHDHH